MILILGLVKPLLTAAGAVFAAIKNRQEVR